MDEMSATNSPSAGSDRRFQNRRKREAEIVLICNPRAGGRWKALANILDSEEAAHVRRIVTDSVDDIAPALAELGRGSKLLCIYGGDGTIQRVLDQLRPGVESETVIALLGGGTMNVTSRWLGFGRNPGRNFRHVVNGFHSGDLLLKEVPLMRIKAGPRVHLGFTFGAGPIVRILDAYERGAKGKIAAMRIGLQSAAAAWLKLGSFREMLQEMKATVTLDDEILPYDRYSALFANVTGQINPGIEPFVKEDRTRDSFYTAAYAVSAREFALTLPFIARGLLPIDITTLLPPWRRTLEEPALATDPRYVNRPARRLVLDTDEPIYTVDGEILQKPDGPIEVSIGPTLKLAVGPNAGLSHTLKAARDRVSGS
jgi:diacylglycerol kinase family enzyme